MGTAELRVDLLEHDLSIADAKRGVIFCDLRTAFRDHAEIVEAYFAKIIPSDDEDSSILSPTVHTGGSFVYVPPGVIVEMPLQTGFGRYAANSYQSERLLIVADEGSEVRFIAGCSSPVYSSHSLHSAVVEIVVKPRARVSYTSIQNWSSNVDNMATKSAIVEAEGHLDWIDVNIGSRLTTKSQDIVLAGPGASCDVFSVAYAGPGQHQDAGVNIAHSTPHTNSKIVSKSISNAGGIPSGGGTVRIEAEANGCSTHVESDVLLLEANGFADIVVGHEVNISKINDDQIFYLMSRGLTEEQAIGMVINGFIEPVIRALPLEYAVEWSHLIELQMEGSVG